MIYEGNAGSDPFIIVATFVAIGIVTVLTYFIFRYGQRILRSVGRVGVMAMTRVLGLMLAAVGVQFVAERDPRPFPAPVGRAFLLPALGRELPFRGRGAEVVRGLERAFPTGAALARFPDLAARYFATASIMMDEGAAGFWSAAHTFSPARIATGRSFSAGGNAHSKSSVYAQ